MLKKFKFWLLIGVLSCSVALASPITAHASFDSGGGSGSSISYWICWEGQWYAVYSNGYWWATGVPC